MFKKVQLKFFLIITSILITLFIGVLAAVNILTKTVMQRQSMAALAQIAEAVEYDDVNSTFIYNNKPDRRFDDGYRPDDEPVPPDNSDDNQPAPEPDDDNDRRFQSPPSPEDEQPFGNPRQEHAPVPKSLGYVDFFIIMADSDGNFLAVQNNDDIDTDAAQSYISKVIGSNSETGMLDSFQFCRMDKSNGILIVFTDKSAELAVLKQLMNTTILIGIASLILLSVLAYFLSRNSIMPIKTAFEKQKQFISDASHELKTPLTVISANVDVLAGEIGENKWLGYISSQIVRMNTLVNDLLDLTRLENDSYCFICSEFDLSSAVENTVLPFECQAFEANKQFDVDIQSGLSLTGSEKHIRQMTAIFIDNALKYSNDGGTVTVRLYTQGDKKILSVFNTGTGLKNDEKNRIFERFYRSDDSRARSTGGYGLGLAIARSIIDRHKFKLTIDNHEDESVCFNIIM